MKITSIFNRFPAVVVECCDANITVAVAAAADYLINFKSKSDLALKVADSPGEWFTLVLQPKLAVCRVKR